MQKIFFTIVLFGILVSCGNPNKKSGTEAVVEIKEETKVIAKILKSRVPTYDYAGLKPFLENENDSTYVVNFWATWCKPCVKELPAFEKLNAEFSNKKVKVLLVSLDFPSKLETFVIPFLDRNNIQSQVVLFDDPDANNWIPSIDKTWSGAIPATIIYNKNKNTFYERSFTYKELKIEVESIL